MFGNIFFLQSLDRKLLHILYHNYNTLYSKHSFYHRPGFWSNILDNILADQVRGKTTHYKAFHMYNILYGSCDASHSLPIIIPPLNYRGLEITQRDIFRNFFSCQHGSFPTANVPTLQTIIYRVCIDEGFSIII